MSTSKTIREARRAKQDGFGYAHTAGDLLRANLRDMRKPAQAMQSARAG